jgi:hypothetical protein
MHVQPRTFVYQHSRFRIYTFTNRFLNMPTKSFDLVAGPSLGFLFNKGTNPVNVGIDASFLL